VTRKGRTKHRKARLGGFWKENWKAI